MLDGGEVLAYDLLEKIMRLFIIFSLVGVLFFGTAKIVCAVEEVSAPSLESKDARELNNAGVNYISKQMYREAAEEFQKALDIAPDFSIARYNLALALYNSGNAEESISEFKKLIQASPYFVNAHYNLGTIFLREERYDEALGRLKKVIELKPDHAEAHFNLGSVYYKKDMYREAIEEYTKGVEIAPDSLNGHLSLGFLYEKVGVYGKALEEYNAALKIDPDNELAKRAIGNVQALQYFSRLITEEPQNSMAHIYLGHIYYAKEMYQEAIEHYRKGLELDPSNKKARPAMERAIVELLHSER